MEDLWTHQTTVRHRNHDVGQFSAYTLTFHKHFCCPTLTHFWLTCLMISEAYRLSAHTSVAPTLTEILQVFWCQAPAKQVWFCILFLLQICCGRGCQSHLSSQWCFAHLENLFPYLWKKIFFFKYKMTISGPSTHSLIESIAYIYTLLKGRLGKPIQIIEWFDFTTKLLYLYFIPFDWAMEPIKKRLFTPDAMEVANTKSSNNQQGHFDLYLLNPPQRI